MDFNSRRSNLFRISSEKERIESEVLVLWITEQSLKTQIAYATSEVAVEEWAREDEHLVKPGDIRVIPIASEKATPTPTPFTIPTQQPVENWAVWYALLFE